MGYITWRVDYTPYSKGTWDSGDTVTVTNPRDILVSVNLGEAKDSFTLNSSNFNSLNNNKFNPNDRIEIYRTSNTDSINTTTDLLMTGTVKNSPDMVGNNIDTTKIEGYNYSEAVTSAIVFADGRTLNIPNALQLALTKAGNNNAFKITWDSSNPSTKVGGGAFDNVDEKWFNWTLKKILEQYSSSMYTGDGAYYWYVTKDNKLKWFSQNDSNKFTEYTFKYTTDEVESIKTAKDIKEVKNHIIIKGGYAPDGKGIQHSEIDYASVNKHGRKYLFHISKVNNATDIVKEDTGSSTTKYPASYVGFVTSWKSSVTATVEGVTMTKGSTVSGIDSDTKYNACIRAHIKGLLQAEAQEILVFYKYGKLKIDLGFRAGTKSWILGDLVTCTLPQAYTGSKVLRVNEIQYSTTTDRFSLVEDEGTL